MNSGTALSLAHTSVYNIEDYYKTNILPPAVHLKRANASSISYPGKTTLHLCIANFKFSYTFVICDNLPDVHNLFGIDIPKRYSLSYN